MEKVAATRRVSSLARLNLHWGAAMLSFSSKKRKVWEAEGFLTKIINNNCPQLDAMAKGERGERRLNLTLPAYVIPAPSGIPDMAAAFVTVTKEIAKTGFGLVLTEPLDCKEVIVGISWENAPTFFRCEIKHQSPIGAGLWQGGLLASEIVPAGDYPAIAKLEF